MPAVEGQGTGVYNHRNGGSTNVPATPSSMKASMMEALRQKLEASKPQIEEICRITGNAGLSLGVLHHAEVVHTAHYGYRDVEAGLPPDDNTIYYFSSLTKAITASAFGILVEEEKISWETLIGDVLPEFNHHDPILNSQANITDILSHRTGLVGKTCAWIQGHQHILLPKEEIVNTVNFLEVTTPLRKRWKYSNWGYALAGEVLERVSSEDYADFLQRRIFEPLGMTRTTANVPQGNNIAQPYMIHDNGSPCRVAATKVGGKTAVNAALGVSTTIKDCLALYKALLASYTAEELGGSSAGTNTCLKQVKKTFTPHIACGKAPITERAYGLGWVRTQLPASFGIIALNNMYLGGMPVIGKSSNQVVLSHSGSLSGYLSAVIMVPETQSAIIVMGNSLPFGDPPDLICQMLLEILIDEPDPVDFVELARSSRKAHFAAYEKIAKELKADIGIPSSLPLQSYVGRYWNSAGNFFIDITLRDTGLRATMQGIPEVGYDLMPYEGQIFWWGPPDREAEECGMVMFPRTYAGWHKFHFVGNDQEVIDSLIWAHDPAVTLGEIFVRRDNGVTASSRPRRGVE